MRFIGGTIFGLIVAAIVSVVGLDNITAALRAAERVTKTVVHEASRAATKATEDRHAR